LLRLRRVQYFLDDGVVIDDSPFTPFTGSNACE
jgi:hypothetical protein